MHLGKTSSHKGIPANSLLVLVSVDLRHRFSQFHLKLIAAQRHVLVVADQCEERVEHQVVSQVVLGAAGFLARVDPAVLHAPQTPVVQNGGTEEKERTNTDASGRWG